MLAVEVEGQRRLAAAARTVVRETEVMKSRQSIVRPRLTDARVSSAMITRSPSAVPTRRPKDAESLVVSRRRRDAGA